MQHCAEEANLLVHDIDAALSTFSKVSLEMPLLLLPITSTFFIIWRAYCLDWILSHKLFRVLQLDELELLYSRACSSSIHVEQSQKLSQKISLVKVYLFKIHNIYLLFRNVYYHA